MSKKDPRHEGAQPPIAPQSQSHPGQTSKMVPAPDHGEDSYRGFGRLQGKVALITGGDSGIGRAVATAYAREGADVAINYLNEHEDARDTKRWVEKAGRKALLLPGDLASEPVCRKVVFDTLEQFGRIDILVNNAAYQGEEVKSVEELTRERLERTFRVNILAMFDLVRAALPRLKPGSVIINVSSIQAYNPTPAILDYAATKGAIVTFSKGLSKELIERGIRVNVVAPGPVWTPLIPASFEPSHVQQHGKSSPLGRTAQPAELAPAFVFLASDESRYITGEVLGVTGGKLLP